jgi:hypothetical protein
MRYSSSSEEPRWGDDQLGLAIAQATDYAMEAASDVERIVQWRIGYLRGLDEDDGGGLGPASLTYMSDKAKEAHRAGYQAGVWMRTRQWQQRKAGS